MLPVSFFFGAAVFYSAVAYFLGEFKLWVGIVLLCGFVVYMVLTLLQMKKTPSVEVEADSAEAHEEEPEEVKAFSLKTFIIEVVVALGGGALMIYKGGIFKWLGIAMMVVFTVYAVITLVRHLSHKAPLGMMNELFFMVVGALIIAGGANLLVDSGTEIATELKVPETVIALTFVALGTSLPELVTAITSLIKGHGALSLGNIIGANLFNLVLVSGVSTVIAPFPVPSGSQLFGIPASLVLDIPVMFGVMLIMTVPALIRGKLSRVQGIVLLCIYAAFCVLQFVM